MTIDWIEFGSKFGIPFLIIVGVAIFWVRYIWPFIIQQVNDSKKSITEASQELTRQREDFLIALDKQTSSITAEMGNRDEKLADALNQQTQILSESLARRDEKLSFTLEKIVAALEPNHKGGRVRK